MTKSPEKGMLLLIQLHFGAKMRERIFWGDSSFYNLEQCHLTDVMAGKVEVIHTDYANKYIIMSNKIKGLVIKRCRSNSVINMKKKCVC